MLKFHAPWISVALLAVTLSAQQVQPAAAPVPVEEEPFHHLVFKNDSIVVVHATIDPGIQSGYHIHSRDRIVVFLNESTTTSQEIDRPEGPPNTSKTGDLASNEFDKPFTHRVRNVGQGTMQVLDVEFPPRPHDTATPPIAPVAVDNRSARAYKWVLKPGANSPTHTHERPYLIVAVTDMELKMISPDGQSSSHPVKSGNFHWIDSKVTHSLQNAGTTEGQIVEIELK